MRFPLFILFVVFIVASCSSTPKELIVGEWTYRASVFEACIRIDSSIGYVFLIDSLSRSMNIEFDNHGQYHVRAADGRMALDGSYYVSEANEIVMCDYEKKHNEEWKIVTLNNDSLIVNDAKCQAVLTRLEK